MQQAALGDTPPQQQLQLVDDHADDTMSEIGADEAAAYQRKLDADSASFLEATPTGVSDADGLLLHSDGTYRPAGLSYARDPAANAIHHDVSTPPGEPAAEPQLPTDPAQQLTTETALEVGVPKRRRGLSPDAMDKDTELVPSSGSGSWEAVEQAILAQPAALPSPWEDMRSGNGPGRPPTPPLPPPPVVRGRTLTPPTPGRSNRSPRGVVKNAKQEAVHCDRPYSEHPFADSSCRRHGHG